jgi:hypothetical protein
MVPVNERRAGSALDGLPEKVVAVQAFPDDRHEEIPWLDLPGIVPDVAQQKILVGIAQERAPGTLKDIP